ncbi:MAG TPA: rod shape-determining protein MreC, partial [Candidatus Paceibacterota bacterium]|nr:rod shape-determining protein MreC [Candidatus Paceibacterota bacterium]
GIVVVFFVLALNVFATEARGFMVQVSSPFQAALWDSGNSISTFFGGGALQRDNQRLREENLLLQSQIVSLQDTAEENEELRKVLQFELTGEFPLVMGEIIGKTLADGIITIKAGEEKGLRKGMPVITSGKGVVGRVHEVFQGYSRIQVLSAEESKFEAKVAGKEISGVVAGQGDGKIIFDFVPRDADLAQGDLVVTSQLGNIFPENLLVGEVAEVIKTGAGPFQKAVVKPFFHTKTADVVFVVLL